MSPELEKRLSNLETGVKEIKAMVEQILEICATAFQDHNIESVLEVKDVAALLNVEIDFIYAKCRDGKIPFERLGKKYKFKKSEIVAWWQGQKAIKGSDVSLDTYVNKYLQENPIQG